MKDEYKNIAIFAVLAAFILFAWDPIMRWAFPSMMAPSQQATVVRDGKPDAKPAPSADPAADGPAATRDRNAVLGETRRVRIETPTIHGSINLKGARIDDLVLKQYAETVEKNSDPIRLFSPAGAPAAYFAGFGWHGTGITAPDGNTQWSASAPNLAPGSPVILTARSGNQRYQITIAVDSSYMFTVKQAIANDGGAPIEVTPYAYLSRAEKSTDVDQWTANVGPIAVKDGAADYINYGDVADGSQQFKTTGGWAGFTDHYWLTALVPDQSTPIDIGFNSRGDHAFQADFQPQKAITVAPGRQSAQQSRLFAGAKEVDILDRYETDGGIAQFGRAIDWGWFEIVEKPIFHYLHWLSRMIGNFGVAIICLTITIRLLLFPIAQRQFASMAQMRAVQPKVKALQEKYKDDKPRLQQETMKLYKDEKVNPLGGCAPTLLQVPIMFALYKVLILTIEMRHQPFVAWIKDLSAPDPLTPVNLFGLLQFVPPHFIAIGVVPILLGISMFFQFKLNPQPMDDTQKQVFAIMPWMMMFMMAPFAVGLQVYWITSNLITIGQQRLLYARHPALKEKPVK